MKESARLYFQEFLGEKNFQAWQDSLKNTAPSPKSIRVNTLKTSYESLKNWYESQGYQIKKSPYSEDGLFIQGEGMAWSLKAPYNMGLCYPQDSASMFAVEWLDPKAGERVIDLTAAPGGKSSHIAQKMQGQGLLLCNDHDRKRLRILHSNLQRLGIWNAYVISHKIHELAKLLPESMDKVLLDPSCSGEGLWGSRKAKPEYWSLKGVKSYAKDQYSLLVSAFAMLKPGGRLVYSTCTLNELEDEGPVKQLLQKFPEAKLLEIPDFAPIQIPTANGEPMLGVRFWPHITQSKGFFCIAIEKSLPPQVHLQLHGLPIQEQQLANILKDQLLDSLYWADKEDFTGVDGLMREWEAAGSKASAVALHLMDFLLDDNEELAKLAKMALLRGSKLISAKAFTNFLTQNQAQLKPEVYDELLIAFNACVNEKDYFAIPLLLEACQNNQFGEVGLARIQAEIIIENPKLVQLKRFGAVLLNIAKPSQRIAFVQALLPLQDPQSLLDLPFFWDKLGSEAKLLQNIIQNNQALGESTPKASFFRRKKAKQEEQILDDARPSTADEIAILEKSLGYKLSDFFGEACLFLTKKGHLFASTQEAFEISQILAGEFCFPVLRLDEALPTHAFSLIAGAFYLQKDPSFCYEASHEILHKIFKEFEAGPYPFESEGAQSFTLYDVHGQAHEYFFLCYQNMSLGLAEKQRDTWIPKVAHLK